MIAQPSWLYRFSAFRPRVIVLFSLRFFWVPFAHCHIFYTIAAGVPVWGVHIRPQAEPGPRLFRCHWGLGWNWGGEVFSVTFCWTTTFFFPLPQPREFGHVVMAFSIERVAFLLRLDKQEKVRTRLHIPIHCYSTSSYKFYLYPLDSMS